MLKNIKIKTILIFNAIVLTIFMLMIAFLGLQGIRIANEGTFEVFHGGVDSIKELSDLQNIYSININALSQKVENGNVSWTEGRAALKDSLDSLPKLLENYAHTDLSELEKSKFEQLKTVIKSSRTSLEKLLEIMRSQDKEALSSYLNNELYAHTIPVIQETDELINLHVSDTKQDYELTKLQSEFFGKIMILLIVIAIVASGVFSFYLIRSITLPLTETVGIINKLATGDNSVQIIASSQNEIGEMMTALKIMVESTKKMAIHISRLSQGDLPEKVEERSENDILARSINDMTLNLRQLISETRKISQGDLTGGVKVRSEKDVLAHSINDMILKLRQMISKTNEEIVVIANSAEEVMASVTHVSSGTTETAAAVAETTTTVEELKQTAQISAEKAQDVLRSSEETAKVVKTSELSLKSTIDEMSHIQEKMNVISESIIKLSEHSLTIGDIITSVNELAEQSNLLAVNAAIEAAKAGDQGKGFGVVAQEIRTLAEQSKAATSQVRSILNEIQNATSTAVMATEQGSKAVNKGVSQSSETNAAMQTLLTNISQVTQAAKQITISSQQQLIGVEQVRMAMSNINQASDQHVEHMKQIETAIASLNEVSKNLKGLINQYKTNADGMDSFAVSKTLIAAPNLH